MTGIGQRCEHCPTAAPRICREMMLPEGCRVAQTPEGPRRAWLLASVRRQMEFVGPVGSPTLDQCIAIDQCRVRSSDCNCTNRPATCRRSGEPLLVICLNQGDDGGPCPGVH